MPATEATAPSRRSRVWFALFIGCFGALLLYIRHLILPSHPGDFGLAWFGARSLLHGANPYRLVGPGLTYDWPWPLVYPATAFVVAMPLAVLPQLPATLVFVFVSCAALGYSVTKRSWARVPMFGSAAFFVAAGSAQWSPLFTAAMTLPVLGIFFIAKPTIGLALGAAAEPGVQKFALGGAAVLGFGGLVLFPEWPSVWLGQLHYATQMAAPIVRGGGLFILLALLRWRRPEARLILALGLVPQIGVWYEALPLFLVAATARESMLFASVSSLGFVLQDYLVTARDEVEFNQQVGAMIVALAYLPAVLMVLKRPNEGDLPAWMRWVGEGKIFGTSAKVRSR